MHEMLVLQAPAVFVMPSRVLAYLGDRSCKDTNACRDVTSKQGELGFACMSHTVQSVLQAPAVLVCQAEHWHTWATSVPGAVSSTRLRNRSWAL
jgi:hypothetical protein